ncbi:hypothetical protein ACIRJR_07165 [Streptomyces sp. NPDC102402]|uniref:hypothetical protein n=1 Tax=Streptomyces sp. NPDC102402 TaxID=3366169 RepID=UPI0037F2592A
MARLHRAVVVTAVDRDRFEECAALLLDIAESTRTGRGGALLQDGRPVPGVRLVKGRHLRAGARYTVAPNPAEPSPGKTQETPGETMTVRIREWRRSTAIAVEQHMSAAGTEARVRLRLTTPDRPSALEAGLALRNPSGGFLQRISGRAKADLNAWWAAADAPAGALPAARAPVTARARHPLGRASVALRVRPADGGAWEVGVTLTVSGRGLLRPPAALALLLFRIPLRRAFRSGVDEAAARWTAAVDGGLPSADALRAELAGALASRNPPDTLPR